MTYLNLQILFAEIRKILAPLAPRGEDPVRAARLIITHHTGFDTAAQLAVPDTPITQDQAEAITNWATRHAAGEPLSRLRGKREFYGLEFALSPDTLDPRPETELIVLAALSHLKTQAATPAKAGAQLSSSLWTPASAGEATPTTPTILDLGTGSGCIPITLLHHVPTLRATATDINQDALITAAQNAARHSVDNRITFITSDWFDQIPANLRFDVITCNPPYIPSSVIETLSPAVKNWDPILALDGGKDGLAPYKKILSGLDTHLSPGGIALLEVGIDQAADVTRLAIKYGLDAHPTIVDSAGIPRVIVVGLPQ